MNHNTSYYCDHTDREELFVHQLPIIFRFNHVSMEKDQKEHLLSMLPYIVASV